MKQICVIGLGQFGRHLARTLAGMGCDVLAIDMADEAVVAVRDEVQQVAILDVRNLEALQSLLTPDVDEAIICLSENMEASILAALHLRQIGVKRIQAKASSADHAAILKEIGADNIIFPERETAERMAHRIINPNLVDYLPLSPEYRVIETPVPKAFVGQSLAQLHLRKKYNLLAIAVKQPQQGVIDFMPSAEAVLRAGNSLVILGKANDIANLPE